MDDKFKTLTDKKTWVLIPKPHERHPMGCKWVYKIKHNADGSICRFKTRLVAKGYNQEYGLNYSETFSLVIRQETIHLKVGLEKCTSQPTSMAVSSSTNRADTPFADITHFRSLIGTLQYLAITRPDIQFAVNRVAQRMHQPSEHDYHCLKRSLRYIFGTLGRGLLI
ncbi:uncharacterized mitochondrial protein AtMg00810-like [Solanum lycopersicum]|uniref:uncharacterized mitochondrial protein AtMg00810-like n=1 Tax=Solanum lycopersicum TaxID=4081 RepID=UPI0037494E61